MYLQFTNAATYTPPSEDDISRDGSLFHGSLPEEHDILRVPLLALPTSTASGGVYSSNCVSFIAATAGDDGSPGLIDELPFTRGLSLVVGGGVIAMPDPDDYTQDIVLSRGYLTEAGQLVRPDAPAEIAVRWQITIK